MRVAYVQTSPKFGAVTRNLEEAYSFITKVKEADLVVLPELFHSGYMVRNRDEAMSYAVSTDKTSEPLEMCLDACRNFGMHIVAGFLEMGENKALFNSAWLLSPDGIVEKYHKVNLFHLEKEIFKPGDRAASVQKIKSLRKKGTLRLGMQVCFDWIFPDGWGRLAWGTNGRNGAQLVAHPANLVIPDKCPLAIRTRAMENRIYIVTAGRVGVDPGPSDELIFRGGSQIVSPDGEILASAHQDSPGCDMVDIDPERADDKFITPLNNVLEERYGTQSDDSES